jgi:hypothetical protein
VTSQQKHTVGPSASAVAARLTASTIELLEILERLDVALDNGRTVETQIDLERARAIILGPDLC